MIPTRYNTDKTRAVVGTRIIGTPFIIFRAWEATNLSRYTHSTITSEKIDENVMWYGTIASRTLPDGFEKIPVGEERFQKVKEFHDQCNKESLAVIRELFPELAGFGREDSGDLEVTLEEWGLSTHEGMEKIEYT